MEILPAPHHFTSSNITSFLGTFMSQKKSSNHTKTSVIVEKPEEVITISPALGQSRIIMKVNLALKEKVRPVSAEPIPDLSHFNGAAAPNISLFDYLERIVKYVNKWAEEEASPSSTGIRCLLMAMDYIERLEPNVLTELSVHRFILSAVLLAVKVTEDFVISNKFWGEVGGCELRSVNNMEAGLCKILNWNLEISSDRYDELVGRFLPEINL